MYLPEDITRDILLRLPIKSLLRLTCVCNRWRYLILSGKFIDSHTKLGRRIEIVISSQTNQIGRWAFGSDRLILENYFQGMALSNTFQLNHNYEVIGHCNGVICLNWHQTTPTTILLWNPALRQCRALPPTDIHLYRAGFGYDSRNQDYKVVINSRNMSRLMTYSLKNDSWKTINSSSLKVGRDCSLSREGGLFFEGRLYWIWRNLNERDEANHRLLVFDLAKEEFWALDLSDTFNCRDSYIWDALGIFRGCISLLTQRLVYGHSFEIWSMEDHCIPQSWTRVVDSSSMELAVGTEFLESLLHESWSGGLTRDGKLLAFLCQNDEPRLHLYNMETRRLVVHSSSMYSTRWFVIPDFIETLVEVIPKVTSIPTVRLESPSGT